MKPLKQRAILLIGAATVFSLLISMYALSFKGMAMQLITQIGGSNSFQILCINVALFSILKIISAFLNTARDNYRRYVAIQAFASEWSHKYPGRINRDQTLLSDQYFLSLYERVPQLVDLKMDSTVQLLTATVIATAFISKTIMDQFWAGLSFLPALMILSWVGNRFLATAYQEGMTKVSEEKLRLIKWLRSYFRGEREARFNWQTISNDQSHREWHQDHGAKIVKTLRTHARTALHRDFVGSICADWPYILGLAVTILAASRGRLSIADLVIWMGLTDYLIIAVNSFRGYLGLRFRIQSL